MAKATGIISLLFVARRAFLQTAAAPVIALWFYQSLPFFSIPFSTAM